MRLSGEFERGRFSEYGFCFLGAGRCLFGRYDYCDDRNGPAHLKSADSGGNVAASLIRVRAKQKGLP
jgi:hypothetical protein